MALKFDDIVSDFKDFRFWIGAFVLAITAQYILGYLGHEVGEILSIDTIHFLAAFVGGSIAARIITGFMK